jgi:peptidoglycan/LPS O-acetylase OafA/YrhL
MGKIRLLLALSVLAAHGGIIWKFHLVGGQIAVQSFFIISGFYMSLILNEKYIGANNSYKLFITNRFLRLYPIYGMVLLSTLLFFLFIAIIPHGQHLQDQAQGITQWHVYATTKPNFLSYLYLILAHILIFGQDVVMFLGINPNNGALFFTSNFSNTHPQLWNYLLIPQAWTLSLELTFYLIAPFILRRGLRVVIPLILLSLLLRFFIYDYSGLRNDPWTYRFFPTEIMFFLVGYLSYRVYLIIAKKTIPKFLNLLALSVPVLLIVLYTVLPVIKIGFMPFSLKEIVFFGTISLSIPILFNLQKNSKLDNQIGELSYPVYIVHNLVIMLCGASIMSAAGWVVIPASIFLAYLLNRFVASPIEKFRQLRLKKATANTTGQIVDLKNIVFTSSSPNPAA